MALGRVRHCTEFYVHRPEIASAVDKDFRIYSCARPCYAMRMKKLHTAFLLSICLVLPGCNQFTKQWIDPDVTFASLDQPEVKGVNETQEQMAKEAVAAADYKRAAQFYQQLVSSGKGNKDQVLRYKMGLAEAVRRMGSNENALDLYDELYQENPTNLDVAEGRALTLMASGKVADAGRAFQEVLDKDPKRWRTLNALGILFVTKDMIPEAMAYYTEALNQSPDNAAILNNVGLSQAVDRNFPRAMEALSQASRVSKSPAQRKQIELNLAMVQGVSGDLETARDTASKYLEGPALDNNLGLYAHLAKDDALAKSYLNMALSQSPTYYERAWENLDAIDGNTKSEGPQAKPLVATPSAVESPVANVKTPPASAKTKSWRKGSKRAEAPVVTEKATLQASEKAEDKPAVKTEEKPAAKAEEKPEPKTDEKPAGLVVAPGE